MVLQLGSIIPLQSCLYLSAKELEQRDKGTTVGELFGEKKEQLEKESMPELSIEEKIDLPDDERIMGYNEASEELERIKNKKVSDVTFRVDQ